MQVGIGHTFRNNTLFLVKPTPGCRDLPSVMPLRYWVVMVIAKWVTKVEVLVATQ